MLTDLLCVSSSKITSIFQMRLNGSGPVVGSIMLCWLMGASVSQEDSVSTTGGISSDQGLGVKAAETSGSVVPSLEPSVMSSLESGDGEPAASGVSPALNVQDVLKELEESIQEYSLDICFYLLLAYF